MLLVGLAFLDVYRKKHGYTPPRRTSSVVARHPLY